MNRRIILRTVTFLSVRSPSNTRLLGVSVEINVIICNGRSSSLVRRYPTREMRVKNVSVKRGQKNQQEIRSQRVKIV